MQRTILPRRLFCHFQFEFYVAAQIVIGSGPLLQAWIKRSPHPIQRPLPLSRFQDISLTGSQIQMPAIVECDRECVHRTLDVLDWLLLIS